jgi:hypothetical protein
MMERLKAYHLLEAISKVTAVWTRQRKAEEPHQRAMIHHLDALTRQQRTSLKAAAWEYM